MTERQAQALADKCLPCPFCGERLVAKNDHHGWWVAHANECGGCECSTSQIHDARDIARWNTRKEPEDESK